MLRLRGKILHTDVIMIMKLGVPSVPTNIKYAMSQISYYILIIIIIILGVVYVRWYLILMLHQVIRNQYQENMLWRF